MGLLQCTEVEERDFEAGLIILDALEKRMTDGRNVALEGVAFYEELIALREVIFDRYTVVFLREGGRCAL